MVFLPMYPTNGNHPSSEYVSFLVENPYQIPDELLIASLGRLLEADANKFEDFLASILARVGLSRTTGHFLLDTFVRTWVSEVLHGQIVEARDLTQFTREARQRVRSSGYLRLLWRAIAGRSVLSETQLIEAAEQVAAETKVAKSELQRILFSIAKLEKEYADIPARARKSALDEKASVGQDIATLQLQKDALEREIALLRSHRSRVLEESPEAVDALGGITRDLKVESFKAWNKTAGYDEVRPACAVLKDKVQTWLDAHNGRIRISSVQYATPSHDVATAIVLYEEVP